MTKNKKYKEKVWKSGSIEAIARKINEKIWHVSEEHRLDRVNRSQVLMSMLTNVHVFYGESH